MSVMFSISASLCREGKLLIPVSGSTQEILVLLQEQDDRHASADIQGSPEPTASPHDKNHHHNKHRHDSDPERAQLPGWYALISCANFSYKARGSAPRPGPDWLGSDPGAASQGDARWSTHKKSCAEVDAGGAAKLETHWSSFRCQTEKI